MGSFHVYSHMILIMSPYELNGIRNSILLMRKPRSKGVKLVFLGSQRQLSLCERGINVNWQGFCLGLRDGTGGYRALGAQPHNRALPASVSICWEEALWSHRTDSLVLPVGQITDLSQL